MWLRLRSRLCLFLLSPPPEAAPNRAGRLRQALLGPTETEIAAILSPLCRRLGGCDVLIGVDGGIRAGVPTAHQRLAIAHEPLAPLPRSFLGPDGLLLLGGSPKVARPHTAFVWETPVPGPLTGSVAHAAAAWTPEAEHLGLGRHTAIAIP